MSGKHETRFAEATGRIVDSLQSTYERGDGYPPSAVTNAMVGMLAVIATSIGNLADAVNALTDQVKDATTIMRTRR